jgi:exodeoxyribonuclease V alpha subunit
LPAGRSSTPRPFVTRSSTTPRAVAEHAHPEYRRACTGVDAAVDRRDNASQAWRDTKAGYDLQLAHYGTLGHHPDPAGYLDQIETAIATIRARADAARDRVTVLLGEPALRALPPGRIDTERGRWHADRHTATAQRRARSAQLDADHISHHRPCDHDAGPARPVPARAPRTGR